MDNRATHVITIANSIIGVSIIAMPYCFKQCGIILSIVILIVSSIISRLSCHLLLKSAIMARRRTFEFLAFHAFGPLGKFIIEIGIIGFLLGTCIAFFVVMGDLGPAIVTKMTGTRATDTLRTSILMALALFCVLPLGLLRNIDSLSSVCTATIGFYFCLVLKIIVQSIPHIFSGDWVDKVELWRPAGFMQCLPIFSMALFCQTQIFEIYQAIPNASLEKMNDLIRLAVNICTGVYIFVGIFGYIAFCGQTFTGNILMSFPTSLMSEVIKIGFVLSLAFSFPLIIFPCRASLYSLLYKRLQTYSLHEGTDKYIPEGRFKGLTFMIVFVSLVTGVMIPNIELVLGLVGSTIGIMICVLFPAMCFICVSTKNTNERILAQLMLFIGVIVMVLGTYANLYAVEEIAMNPITEKVMVRAPEILKLLQEDPALKVIDTPNTSSKAPVDWKPDKKEELSNQEPMKEVRHEPPQPEEPAEVPAAPQIKDPPKEHANQVPSDQERNQGSKGEPDNKKLKDSNIEKPVDQLQDNIARKKNTETSMLPERVNIEIKDIKNPQVVEAPIDNKVNEEETGKTIIGDGIKNIPIDSLKKVSLPVESVTSKKISKIKMNKQEIEIKSNGKKAEEVDKEAIAKEDHELLEQENAIKEEEKKNFDLIKSLEERNKEQKKLVEEKKKILEEIKQRQHALEQDKQQKEIDKVQEEKLKAVEQIEQIAKKAIEKLSGADQQNNVEKVHEEENIEKQPKDINVNFNHLETDSKINSVQLNPINPKVSLDEKPKESDFKIGLTKENLVPIPIALSNNLSEIYKNMVAAKNDVPKVIADVPDLPKGIDAKKSSEKIDHIVTFNQNDVKQTKQDAIVFNKEDQITLFDVLRTKPETALNKEPQENIILHREIRSAENYKEDKNLNNDKQQGEEKIKNEKEMPVIEKNEVIIEKTIKNSSRESIEKFEDSCDKNDLDIRKEKKIGSTETPLIKMITKLSNPELVSIKLPDVDNLNADSILKPLKRDLKSYKSRRRK